MSGAGGVLVLTRRDISDLMAREDWLAAAQAGFRGMAEGRVEQPPPMHLAGAGGAFHAKAASLRDERLHVALKLNGNFPANPDERGLPTVQGVVLLCDGETGAPLAILDSIALTLWRTAAASALAARLLARPDSRSLLVCGCGAQAASQLDMLRLVLPLERALVWDRDHDKARGFAAGVAGLAATATSDLAGAARRSDVIVTCTTAHAPFLRADQVRAGTFVAAVGADAPDKNEVEPALMATAKVVTDSTGQCAAMGDLRHALAAGAMRREDVHAELAGIVVGARPGRVDGEEIFLFDSTGTALQDVAAAALIHERARAQPGMLQVELAA